MTTPGGPASLRRRMPRLVPHVEGGAQRGACVHHRPGAASSSLLGLVIMGPSARVRDPLAWECSTVGVGSGGGGGGGDGWA